MTDLPSALLKDAMSAADDHVRDLEEQLDRWADAAEDWAGCDLVGTADERMAMASEAIHGRHRKLTNEITANRVRIAALEAQGVSDQEVIAATREQLAASQARVATLEASLADQRAIQANDQRSILAAREEARQAQAALQSAQDAHTVDHARFTEEIASLTSTLNSVDGYVAEALSTSWAPDRFNLLTSCRALIRELRLAAAPTKPAAPLDPCTQCGRETVGVTLRKRDEHGYYHVDPPCPPPAPVVSEPPRIVVGVDHGTGDDATCRVKGFVRDGVLNITSEEWTRAEPPATAAPQTAAQRESEEDRIFREFDDMMEGKLPQPSTADPRAAIAEAMRAEASKHEAERREHREDGHDTWAAEAYIAASTLTEWADRIANWPMPQPTPDPAKARALELLREALDGRGDATWQLIGESISLLEKP